MKYFLSIEPQLHQDTLRICQQQDWDFIPRPGRWRVFNEIAKPALHLLESTIKLNQAED